MNRSEFDRLAIGAHVLATSGGHQHVAKVLQKDHRRRKVLLRFRLVDGAIVDHWRRSITVARCDCLDVLRPLDRRAAPGLIRRWLGQAEPERFHPPQPR